MKRRRPSIWLPGKLCPSLSDLQFAIVPAKIPRDRDPESNPQNLARALVLRRIGVVHCVIHVRVSLALGFRQVAVYNRNRQSRQSDRKPVSLEDRPFPESVCLCFVATRRFLLVMNTTFFLPPATTKSQDLAGENGMVSREQLRLLRASAQISAEGLSEITNTTIKTL